MSTQVIRVADIGLENLKELFEQFGLNLTLVPDRKPIPGSHWGDDEAGLIQCELFLRLDTPVHSVFHEACHWLLMDEARRSRLHTNAGGTQLEENAVCYLQILLADEMPGLNRASMFKDMDAWGYSFRLGSAERWFNEDAEDALAFLQSHSLFCSPTAMSRLVRLPESLPEDLSELA